MAGEEKNSFGYRTHDLIISDRWFFHLGKSSRWRPSAADDQEAAEAELLVQEVLGRLDPGP